MKFRKNFNKIICAILAISSVIIFAGCSSNKKIQYKQVENVAISFIDNIFKGNAKKFTELLYDDIIEQIMTKKNYETKDIFIYALDKRFDSVIEDYKSSYGKKWKYTIDVIDSYDVESPSGFSEYEFKEVVLEVQHEGKKLLFFKVEGSEELKIKLIKANNSWYVFEGFNIWL